MPLATLSRIALLAACLAASVHAAVEITASGISLPFFNDAGQLTHKLLARHGTTTGGLQKLQTVELQYYSATEPRVIVQKLEATEATWDPERETLVGRGPIVVATIENRLRGEGFDFALGTSRLQIHRQFQMENDELSLSSDRATIDLIVDKSGEDVKVRDVKRCEAIGNLHIVVRPAAQKTYRIREAFSDLGIYDGIARVVTLPHPTRTIQLDGGEGRFETFRFNLETKTKK